MALTDVNPVAKPSHSGGGMFGGALGGLAGAIVGGATAALTGGAALPLIAAGGTIGSLGGGTVGNIVDPAKVGNQSTQIPHADIKPVEAPPLQSMQDNPMVQLANLSDAKNALKNSNMPMDQYQAHSDLFDNAINQLKLRQGIS